MKASVKKVSLRRSELLFEIGCEEIPAGLLPKAQAELRSVLEKYLVAENLAEGAEVVTFAAPRRLVAQVREIRLRQLDLVKEVLGPPKSVAYDSVGAPTRAAVSFADKQGIALDKIQFVATPKGEYLAVKQVIPGRTTEKILAEILPRVIQDLTWPRSMTWAGLSDARFIRPIRWIVAVLDGKPVRFSYGDVASGERTRGHRFLGKPSLPVKNFREYEAKLKANGVIVRPELRRAKIEKELTALGQKSGLKLHADAELLDMVTYLNEFPSVIQGQFDPAFLDLPDEILITVMRGHQKYFAVEKRGGDLAPHFLAVINLDRDPKGLVRAGHERVLRARFADAQFFWKTDQKCRLADYLPKLERVTYESRLGSYRDKVERVRAVARWIASQWFNLGLAQAHVPDADRAAELAKCDLATEMVREFTELQGVVGGLYARAQGESPEVADAVYDHYLPASLEDAIPRNLTGCAVSLADKLDSVAGCFAVGIVPTGSSDPYALRRAAQGIVKIILERSVPLSLALALGAAVKALQEHAPKIAVPEARETQILEFIQDRARFVFREKLGFAYDEVNAVFRAGSDNLVDARQRLEALRAIRKSKNFEPLTVSFKRIRKILEKAPAAEKGHAVSEEFLKLDAERDLHAGMREAARQVQARKREGKYREALEVIADLRNAVDRFFVDVMVMAEEEAVRRNRLALLGQLLAEFTTIADFSEIGGEESR
ncbi:MAG: glycine--tRNA ligase subunit beta [Acidobacteriia bacterium]|nr:glycine--tRNA ligase subunit beta [Terriglobia bacterium]